MNVANRLGAIAWGAVVCWLFSPGPAWAAWTLNLTRGVTPYSREVYWLHMVILWICVIIGVGVFSAIFYSLLKFRKSQGAVAAQFHHSTAAEITWTVIPILILIGMAVPATKALIMMEDTANSDLTIKVTGYQWKWGYEYLEDGIQFFSTLDPQSNAARQLRSGTDPRQIENYLLDVDNHVVIPTHTKVRFLTTAADVIHAWWVPDLGWKRDAVPGFINESWVVVDKPGIYRGQCTELCGKDHGFMPIVVEAVPAEEYRAWVERQRAALEQPGEPVADAR
jgi:cytochrome c oxidase subunit 2